MALERYERVVLSGILLFGLAIRLIGIDRPLLDHHSWKQTDLAGIARNITRDPTTVLLPRGDRLGLASPEFPVYPATVALSYRIFGIHESLGRLLSVSASVATMLVLYLLAKRFFGSVTALFASFTFAILPLNLYYSRSFIAEPTLMLFSVSSLYFFSRWIDRQRWPDYVWAVLCTTMAFLIKIPTLYLGLPLLTLALVRWKRQVLRQWKLWLFLFVVLFLPLTWYWHAISAARAQGLVVAGAGNWFQLTPLRSLGFYKVIGKRLFTSILTPLGFALFTLGVILKVERREQWAIHGWLVATGVYVLIGAAGMYGNDYYMLGIVPVGAIFIGKGLTFLTRRDVLQGTILDRYVPTWAVISLLLVTLCLLSYISAKPLYAVDTRYLAAAQTVKELTDEDDHIVTLTVRKPEVLYYSDRRGWAYNLHQQFHLLDVQDVETGWTGGASYLVVVKADDPIVSEAVSVLSRVFDTVLEDQGFVIFAVGQGGREAG